MDAESQALFAEMLARYNRDRYDASQWPEYGLSPQGYAPALWSEMQAMGWFELLRPDDGRAAAPLADLLPLFATAGEALWREPIGSVFAEPVAVIAAMDDGERRRELLAGLISGERPLACAHREPGDGWSGEIATRATKTAAGYSLDGRKAMVVGDAACVALLVSAIDPDTQAAALFLVEANAPRLSVQRYRTVDDLVAADLDFGNTPAERLCSGAPAIRQANARGAILAAAESLGIMRGANRDSTDYLRERKQFGQALLGFQALQHRLVEMHMRQHECAALVASAAEAFDDQAPDLDRQLLVLRVQVSRALRHITREAVQLHGGMGVTQALRIGRYYKRALMLDSLHGTADWALEALSELR
ncbi:acyl-CoA dehydrogenase family protein [Nevskia ramosa]|uniref:acyl-CoA dehydrogenase family protein n=1 Tax=Nevskia ramosa TaxID=64002 RepID=UPI0023522A05|nr:acyl-CoA dehydrogenase [Nevskia ramosa]